MSRYFIDSPSSAFQFTSAFRYSSVSTSDCDYDLTNECQTNRNVKQSSLYYIITIIFYLILLLTFPFSIWFCVRRIKTLQRCIIFRLGNRLPLKGPGLVIKFPLIDVIEVVDMNDHSIQVVDPKQELLTGEGSIIKFPVFVAKLTVTNAIKSITQLKDAKFNSQQFVRLAFSNMIGSTHLEDIENKTEYVLRNFEENCNIYLNNWGWQLKIVEIPKLIVVERRNPVNPLVAKLKGVFNSGASGSNDFFKVLQNFQLNLNDNSNDQNFNLSSKENSSESTSASDLTTAIQSIANKYSQFVTRDVFIQIETKDKENYIYKLCHKSGLAAKTLEMSSKADITVEAETIEDVIKFCRGEQTNKVVINTCLF